MSKKSSNSRQLREVEKVMKTIEKPKLIQETKKSKKSSVGQETIVIDPALKDQYNVIKKDILKLRKDLSDGYDMAKTAVEKERKGFLKQFFADK